MQWDYRPPGPVAARFMQSSAFVRGLMGPVGSGKSVTCCMEIYRRALEQRKSPDGVRRSRWAVVRNTYPELKTTTIKTWFDWFPRNIGHWQAEGPPTHTVDGDFGGEIGRVRFEVLFLALDRPEDVRKLLSLELTGAWINEAREIPRAILDGLTSRVGRYPSARDGGASWTGVIMDTNPPDTDHWWAKLADYQTPEDAERLTELERTMTEGGSLTEGQRLYEFFRQPGGLQDGAENSKGLDGMPGGRVGYYQRASANKGDDWIRVYVDGQYGFVQDGKPVYPEYRDGLHTAPKPLRYNPALPLTIGVDFGLTPAAAICQRTVLGRWHVLAEIVLDNAGAKRLGEMLAATIGRDFPGATVQGWGDPAGLQRAQTDEQQALDLLSRYSGFKFRAAPSNSPTMRLEAVKGALSRLIDGEPGILIDPRCTVLRKGFASHYRYRRLQTTGGERYNDSPEKNEYSHIHDALQYAFLGGGEASVLRHTERNKITQTVAYGVTPGY